MPKKAGHIRINKMVMAEQPDTGIAIERLHISASEAAMLNDSDEAKQSHREDRHSFFVLEKGTVTLEIDFQKFKIRPSSVVYMHPDQVHRILSIDQVTVGAMAINNENLRPEYLIFLESLVPARPLVLGKEAFLLVSEAVSLCVKFSLRSRDRLYHSLLKDSCNALVALIASQYLASVPSAATTKRFNLIANSFKSLLDRHFVDVKSPAAYAQKLNISTPYLNECVKNSTGFSVSYHIHQRVILEAKRLLYHSDQSVKEISAALGYDDYPYFSRFFTKGTGMTPLTFRKKNLE